MTMFRQLYYGSGRDIATAKGLATPPSNLKNFLGELTTVPEWIQRWKRSSCRQGALRVLALAKACYPDIDPAKLAGGFPRFNADGTEFSDKDFARVVRETRVIATSIADELDLKKFQPSYDQDGKKVVQADPILRILAPPQAIPAAAPSPTVGTGTPVVAAPSRPPIEDEICLEFID